MLHTFQWLSMVRQYYVQVASHLPVRLAAKLTITLCGSTSWAHMFPKKIRNTVQRIQMLRRRGILMTFDTITAVGLVEWNRSFMWCTFLHHVQTPCGCVRLDIIVSKVLFTSSRHLEGTPRVVCIDKLVIKISRWRFECSVYKRLLKRVLNHRNQEVFVLKV